MKRRVYFLDWGAVQVLFSSLRVTCCGPPIWSGHAIGGLCEDWDYDSLYAQWSIPCKQICQ